MPSYLNMQKTFRLNPWNGVRGTPTTAFKKGSVTNDLGGLLDFVFKELDEIHYPFVKKSNFTLINVYNALNGNSVGYLDKPHEDLIKHYSGIVLTFSLTSRPLKHSYPEVFVNNVADETAMWGKDLLDLTSNVVINIPREHLKRWRIKYGLTEDLLYLYNVLGMSTKNFVLTAGTWYDPRTSFREPTSPLPVVQSMYFEKSFKSTINDVPFSMWAYVKDMWQRIPNLIHKDSFNDSFKLYYIRYLLPIIYTNNLGGNAKTLVIGKGTDTLHGFISKGVRELDHYLRTGRGSITKHIIATLHLIYIVLDGEGIIYVDDLQDIENRLSSLKFKLDSNANTSKVFFEEVVYAERMATMLLDESPTLKPLIEALL